MAAVKEPGRSLMIACMNGTVDNSQGNRQKKEKIVDKKFK